MAQRLITISKFSGIKKEQLRPSPASKEKISIFPSGTKTHDALGGTRTLYPSLRLFRTQKQRTQSK